MPAQHDLLLKLPAPRFPHRDDAGRRVLRQLRIDRHVEIALGPGRDDARHIGGVARAADEVIGAGERDETFGMLCREKNLAGIVDADRVVGRRMKHQQRLVQVGDEGFEILLRDIVEQAAADAERPAGQRHLDLVLIVELGNAFAEQPDHMGRIERRRDRHHGARLGDAMRGGEHRGAAEAVADQDRRRHERRPQMIGGGDQIVDIRRKRGVGELALAGAKPGKIEAQHRDAVQSSAITRVVTGEFCNT